jgi:hypothetical protein
VQKGAPACSGVAHFPSGNRRLSFPLTNPISEFQMKKSPACRAVAARLGVDQRRVVRLVQDLTEAGLVPSGYRRHDLSHRELARILIAAVADRGLHYAAQAVAEFAALESSGLRFDDWLESAIASRVNVEPIVSLVFQIEPPAVSVLTDSAQLDFGERADVATTKVVAISGEAFRDVIEDFTNGMG